MAELPDKTELPDDSDPSASQAPVRQNPKWVVDQAYLSRLRELELELDKTRSEAHAARLDARAAELKLRIQKLGGHVTRQDQVAPQDQNEHGETLKRPAGQSRSDPGSIPTPLRQATVFQPTNQPAGREKSFTHASPNQGPTAGELQPQQFADWDEVRRTIATGPTSKVATATTPRRTTNERPLRMDRSHETSCSTNRTGSATTAKGLSASAPQTKQFSGTADARSKLWIPNQDIALSPTPAETAGPRKKTRVWLVSVVFHTLVLVLLGFWTLASTPPRDQIAIAGSVSETDDIAVESLTIETPPLPATPSVPPTLPSETQYEISDFGRIAISDMINDVPPAPPSPLIDSVLGRDALQSASMSLKSDHDATMEFCGVQGGGNHFVYLVDSSGSMREAFESARAELLRSINVLTPDQRFYVIFFDAESDYMRLTSPDRDEARSVFATLENKQALQRWAMTIKMDRGRAPYDALPFALELGPDVIFLLSDGEFPQSIEDLLSQINRVDNLFGDEGPLSIIHTIGYHSRDGESRMKRIATQNGGQYRHVPKP